MSLKNSNKVVAMKDRSLMVKGMEKESSFIKMEECMTDNGNKIKWKGMEHFTMIQVKLLMRENGKMINFMEKENYIIKIQDFWDKCLIFVTLTKLMSIGNTMKVNL